MAIFTMTHFISRLRFLNGRQTIQLMYPIILICSTSGLASYFYDKYLGRKLIVIAAVVSLGLVIKHLGTLRLHLRDTALWPLSLLFLVMSLGLTWLIHQGGVDGRRLHEAFEISLIGAVLYLYIVKQPAHVSMSVSIVMWVLALGTAATGIISAVSWQESGFVRRMWLGTSMINISAGTQLLLVAAVAAFTAQRKVDRVTPLLVIAVLLGSVGVFSTGSRGAWLGLLTVHIISAGWMIRKLESKRILIVALTAVLISTLVALSFVPQVKHRVVVAMTQVESYFSEEPQRKTSVGLRFEMWRSALDGLIRYPLTGMGGAQLGERWQGEQHDFQLTSSSPHVHSDYLEAAQTRGLIGLLSVFLMLFIPVYLGWKYRHSLYGKTLLTIALSFSVVCVFDTHLVMKFALLYYITLISVLTGLMFQAEVNPPSSELQTSE